MPRKRPCTICRRWFRPDPRVGTRQRACGQADCRAALRQKTQAAWRARNPDYFIARRMQARKTRPQPPNPLRLPPPLNGLPWDLAQDEFGVQGADFLGVMGTLLLGAAQDEIQAYEVDSKGLAGTLPPFDVQDELAVQAE